MGSSNSKKKKVHTIPVIIYNLKGKEIVKQEEGYYNLATNRWNKNLKPDLLIDEVYKVMGTMDEMQGFYEINHITENTVCELKGNNTILYAPETDDVSKIPDSYIQNLCPFSLSGLQTKAKVITVLDGDTIDLFLFVPLKFLFSPKYYQHERRGSIEFKESSNRKQVTLLKSSKPTSKKIQNGGLYMLMNARLQNLDTAEKNTPQGQLAKQMMIDKYQSLKNIVYCNLFGFDKYGRILCDLFEDEERRKYINYYLIGYIDPKLGKIAEVYKGDTKSSYMKDLPTIN